MPQDKLTSYVRLVQLGSTKWRWSVSDHGELIATGTANKSPTASACAAAVIAVIRVCSTPADTSQVTYVKVTPDGTLVREAD